MDSSVIADESLPLWVRIEECMRLLDRALKEAKSRGAAMVDAEADYYNAKANASFAMLEEGKPVTFIQTVIKGIPEVAQAMGEYHAAEVMYKNALDALNVYKLKLRVLESEQEREYEQAKRM